MAISGITDQFCCDMEITRSRYTELIVAEQDATRLKQFLAKRLKSYRGITHEDLKTLCDMLCINPDDSEDEG